MSAKAQRKLFTSDEYHHMVKAGILEKDNRRLELIQGELIHMAAIGSRHAACVNRLNRLFSRLIPDTMIVSVQNPVQIGRYTELEPDISILKQQADFYAAKHPVPSDVMLIVEVSDTSLEDDREIKLPLYAKAGIREVWIVNLKASCLEIYTIPFSRQQYGNVKIVRRGCLLSTKILPDAKIYLDDIIGQEEYPLSD